MANEALLFYSQMKSASPGTKADPYTYSSTLKACTDTRNFKMECLIQCARGMWLLGIRWFLGMLKRKDMQKQ
ncbi:hypothetical protein FF1_045854 [Malus domestica]